ncbi:hypothetical protein OG21DRAFT_1525021 [Imleria badia]|nr:hypothetical protein OG21DRAFT_1525021 [Imleria badia]
MDIATASEPLNLLTPVQIPKQKVCVGKKIAASAMALYAPLLKPAWQTYTPDSRYGFHLPTSDSGMSHGNSTIPPASGTPTVPFSRPTTPPFHPVSRNSSIAPTSWSSSAVPTSRSGSVVPSAQLYLGIHCFLFETSVSLKALPVLKTGTCPRNLNTV